MAWVTEYDLTWRSWDAVGEIALQRDGGSYQGSLNLKQDSLEISNRLQNWEAGLMRQNCVFTIINDCSDFYELLPLMTLSSGQIRVVVTMTSPSTETLFKGYLNPEAVNQRMLANADIRLVASGLISKLKGIHPDIIDTVDTYSLIQVIDECLRLTGSSYPIRVVCSLFPNGGTLTSGHTLFNKVGVNSELFWKNNYDRMDGEQILESIMRSFNCYLYWYQDYWYIEHYQDLGVVPIPFVGAKDYVQYESNESPAYSWGKGGSANIFTISEWSIHSPTYLPQIGDSQNLKVTPGFNIVEIRNDDKPYWNLIVPITLNNLVEGNGIERYVPDFRTWHAYEDDDSESGMFWLGNYATLSYLSIANCMARYGYNITDVDQELNGLTTRFRITVKSDTELTIKFKYSAGTVTDNPSNYQVTFHWAIKNGTGHGYAYDDSTEEWTYENTAADTFIDLTKTIELTDIDSDTKVYEGSLTIPIGEIMEGEGDSEWEDEDIDLIFRMGQEIFTYVGPQSGSPDGTPLTFAVFGDFKATISEEKRDNLFAGTVNEDFLAKKTIKLDMFDTGSYSYRNCLRVGSGWNSRTTTWSYDDIVYYTLVEWIMMEKLRLYNASKQIITLSYVDKIPSYATTPFWRPLTMWYDNKQSNKRFIMAGDVYKPSSNTHMVEFWEYDDNTIIDLVDEDDVEQAAIGEDADGRIIRIEGGRPLLDED